MAVIVSALENALKNLRTAIALAEGDPAAALRALRDVLGGTAPVVGYLTVTEAQLLAGLYKIKDQTFGGLTPPVSYGPAGSPHPQIPCYYIFTVKNGKYVAPTGLRTQCAPTT